MFGGICKGLFNRPAVTKSRAVKSRADQAAGNIIRTKRAAADSGCVDGHRTGAIDGVICENHPLGLFPAKHDAPGMIDDCIVDNLNVPNVRDGGVWSCRDAGCRAVENYVISDNRVGNDLDAFACVPDNVALDDVDAFAAAVHENAGIFRADIRVVDDVVTDYVPVRAEFYFDTVVASDAGAARVVNVVALDERVGGDTRTVMAADIHPFSFGRAAFAQTGMVDVIPSDDKGVAVSAVHRQGIVEGVTYLAIFEYDVVSPDKTHARAAAFEPDCPNGQVLAIDELDIIVSRCGVFRMCEQRLLTFGGTNRYRFFGGAFSGDGAAGRL